MKIIYTNNDKDPRRERVVEGLISYNKNFGPPEVFEWVAFYAENEKGELMGGLHGYLEWDYLLIKHLWVAEQGKGTGKNLLAEAEKLARKKGMKGVWLDTFEFQAPEFYEKQGYRIFGEIPNAANNYKRYFFIKTFNN